MYAVEVLPLTESGVAMLNHVIDRAMYRNLWVFQYRRH